ncbi:MAG TPA: hypothetical protein VFU45_01155 [Gemmatimonadales bacterium]|nr:hypothetical protein [Gemmatimonadales bacterium]
MNIPEGASPPPGRTRLGGPALVLLAALAMGGVVLHRFWLQDEIPIIEHYRMIHGATGLWLPFLKPYWPPPFSPDLYRPLSLVFFTLQWAAGDGAIWLFHLLNLVLYILCVTATWRLARQMLPAGAAWAAAALFAVHPVHVEAAALSINQSETLVALLIISAVGVYVDWRRAPDRHPRAPWVVLALYLVSCLVKESGIVLPGLLLAAELTILDDGTPLVRRAVRLRPWALGMMLIASAFIGVRTLVLHGFVGSFLAEGLFGLGWSGRVLTMLGVVPRWAALTLWPAHLQEDYSPREIVGTNHWGTDQTLGLLILLVTLVLLVRSWRRNKAAAFGLLWFFVAIFPVSNVVVPTGIVLAERTLFLPSVGVALALGGLVAGLVARYGAGAGLLLRRAAPAALALVLVLGVVRSFTRMKVWHDPRSLWGQSMLDAPESFRVNEAFAYLMQRIGRNDRFVYYMRQAIALAGRSARLNTALGDWYRNHNDCTTALPLYAEALRIDPEDEVTRASSLACLFSRGKYRQARGVATVGRGYLPDSRVLARFQVLSESLAVADPAGRGVKLTIDSLAPALLLVTGPAAR